jgi:ribose 5-phosphate isomerase A
MTEPDDAKRAAARAALQEIPETGIIGIGTGSTVAFFVEALAELVASGKRYLAVPTSEATRTRARELGIELLDDDGPWDIAVTIDGADELDGELHLIKGGGGAHAREKIVNCSSRRNVIIADASKLSRQLGEQKPVPVEVLAFGHRATAQHLAILGTPKLRTHQGALTRTDAGNVIYDLACGPIANPAALDRELRAIPGVVETGLFVGRADVVYLARGRDVRRLTRPG